eukprot:CAMPEP_0185780800 /NCGR_PEP_ID=MMETSP1174-20130828/100201_1 /TAXON_ID=35687 /ORGANISM="Dictyocha speculum, Strain CCMP1381" /LENGTH=159 /DNA_ID=CAMNT_0028470493 /DNA_START=321 /DNA_END=798 /DNA_ORIENTATION=+
MYHLENDDRQGPQFLVVAPEWPNAQVDTQWTRVFGVRDDDGAVGVTAEKGHQLKAPVARLRAVHCSKGSPGEVLELSRRRLREEWSVSVGCGEQSPSLGHKATYHLIEPIGAFDHSSIDLKHVPLSVSDALVITCVASSLTLTAGRAYSASWKLLQDIQ